MFSAPNEHVWKRKYGGGCLSLFGLPFLLAGVSVIAVTMGIVDPGGVGGEKIPLLFGLPFGGVFAFVGAALVFGRAGLEINTLTGKVKSWWGFLMIPIRSQEYPLSEFDRITLARETRSDEGQTQTVYALRLSGESHEIHLQDCTEYEQARRQSEELSRFCGLPISDRGGGEEVLRDPQKLDESLRERADREGADVDVPVQPTALQTEIQFCDSEIILHLPSRGGGFKSLIFSLLGLLLPMGFVGYWFIWPMLQAKNAFNGPGGVVLALLLFTFIVAPLFRFARNALGSMGHRIRVIASPDQLTVEEVTATSTRRQTIPTDQLEDLVLPPLEMPSADELGQVPPLLRRWVQQRAEANRGIIARSDALTLTFGNGLPADELEYLHAVLLKILTV